MIGVYFVLWVVLFEFVYLCFRLLFVLVFVACKFVTCGLAFVCLLW